MGGWSSWVTSPDQATSRMATGTAIAVGLRGGADESRIYISGDTLMVDELKEIPERYKGQNIDLMLVHLGGTTIPSPKLPLLMVTMDAKQGIELIRLIQPEVTIPIHTEHVLCILVMDSSANHS